MNDITTTATTTAPAHVAPSELIQGLYRSVFTPLLQRAMAPTLADAVRALYAAIAAADLERVRAALTDDAVLHVPGTHALGGDYAGPDGFVEFLAGTWALTGGSERLELVDVLTGADHVAAYCRVAATRPGRPPLDNTTVHVLRLRGDLVAEAWLHNWDDAHVGAFWAA